MSDYAFAIPFPLTSLAVSNQISPALWGTKIRDKSGNEFQMVLVRGSTVATFHGGGAFWHLASNVLTGYTVTPDVSQGTSLQEPAGIFMMSLSAAQVNAGTRLAWVLKKGNPATAGLRAIVTNGTVAAGDYLCMSASDGRFKGVNASASLSSAVGLRNRNAKLSIFSPSADGATSLITSTRIGAVRVNCQ